MRHRQGPKVPLTATMLVGCFGWIVPARERWEWRQEWQSELWYVYRDSGVRSAYGAWKTCTVFALGAFNDAFWLWRNAETRKALLQSAKDCTGWLLILSAISFLVACLVPGSREAMTSPNETDRRHLVSITRAGLISGTTPTIDLAEYERWKSRGREWFSSIAFYRVTNTTISDGDRKLAVGRVAVASDSFAQMFDLTILPEVVREARNQNRSLVVLAPALVRKWVGPADPIGRQLNFGPYPAVIGAVQPSGRSMPPNIDALLLVSDIEMSRIASDPPGYAFADMTPAAQALGRGGKWSFTTREDGENIGFVCSPIADRSPRPLHAFLFALFLACLALPATTPLPLSEYPAAQHPRFGQVRWRRWVFLATKLLCLTATVAFVSLVISFGRLGVSLENAVCVQLLTSFVGLLFSFRWALRDQRLRCPVCLGLLTNPARVGHPSRSFLAWHGTELMCDKGHGLLHVPEMATSWFSTQRWLSLDGSWRGLFLNLAD